jgi:hypothetical protein
MKNLLMKNQTSKKQSSLLSKKASQKLLLVGRAIEF